MSVQSTALNGATSGEPFVTMSNITKRFAGAVALENVSVSIEPGEIYSLVGANGAGKSTLGKILAGVHSPDSGRITVNGTDVHFSSPTDALRHGIAIMQQEIALAEKLSVVDNVFLGTEFGSGPFLGRRKQVEKFEQLRLRTGFNLSPNSLVEDLRVGEQQQVSVLWALARDARLVVMDEPTASLDRADSVLLLDTARRLAEEGIAVVFVSHFLDEVKAISDTVTILANGKHVLTRPADELSEDDMVEAMIGGKLDAAFPPLPPPPDPNAGPVLTATSISQDGVLHDISLHVRPGEILGIYGLVGSGRSEFAHVLAGASSAFRGTVAVDGKPVKVASTGKAIAAGIALLPESRKDQGLFLGLSVVENVAAAALGRFTNALGFVKRRALRAEVNRILDPLALRGGNRLDERVGNFSGGNQQKVLFAKCLIEEPRVLILDEPTRGVDIGAKRAIYDVIVDAAASGVGVIVISSEHAEVLHLCHRVVVFHDGRIVDTFDHGVADEGRLLTAALGTVSLTLPNEAK